MTAGASGSLRVAVAISSLRMGGGAQTQVVHLVRGLVGRGDEVQVLSVLGMEEGREAHADQLGGLGVPLLVLQGVGDRPHLVPVIGSAVRALRRFRPDVLVCFLFHANVLGRVAGRLAGVPVIISSIRNEVFGGKARDLATRVTDRLGTVTTTNSARVAARLASRHVTPATRLVVIPNALDPSPFTTAPVGRDQVRAELGVAPHEFLWLCIARLEPQKGHRSLVSAFGKVHAQHADTRLALVGDGPLRGELRAHVAALGLGTRVELLGRRGDVPALLAACDALVLASRWEGTPNVVMEAMASGRPVVATAVGGTEELVVHGKHGFLCPAEDAAALAGAMIRLQDLPHAQRAALGTEGREEIVSRSAVDVVVPQWLALIDACASARRGGSAGRQHVS